MDFQRGTVALSTRKTRTGNVKRDEMPMNPEVRATLLWLLENREGTSGHVFTCPVGPFIGQPYKVAAHVMRRLCERAGVKAFGFHAIRHLAATILAQEGKSLFAIQHALRHEKQTTTDRYLHSLGTFSEVSDALSASGQRDSLQGGASLCTISSARAEFGESTEFRLRAEYFHPSYCGAKAPICARWL